MNVLAIDGALGTFSVAVADRERIVAVREVPTAQALEQGLAAVDAALAAAGRPRLDRIAVGTGPGRFTGLRIAIGYAKSLALGWGIGLAGIGSYDALEGGALDGERLTVISGRPGVIAARYVGPRGTHVAAGAVDAVLATLLADVRGELRVAGAAEDARAALAERGITVLPIPAPAEPAAATIARLAQRIDPAPTPHAVRPDYGEAPAVSLPAGKRR